MNDSDYSTLHAMHMTVATEAPHGATICTVHKVVTEVWINCAGFKRQFRNLHHAADYLQIEEWRDLERMLIEQGSPLILCRRDTTDKWHPV